MKESLIKEIEAESLDDYFNLIQDVVRGLASEGISQWDELYPAKADIEADIKGKAAYGYIVGGRAAAYFALNEVSDPQYDEGQWIYNSGKPLIVHRLSVHPDFKGRGIGRAMLSFAEGEAARLGYGAIRLDAFSLNPSALHLYENSGYRKAGEVMFRKGLFFLFEKDIRGLLNS